MGCEVLGQIVDHETLLEGLLWRGAVPPVRLLGRLMLVRLSGRLGRALGRGALGWVLGHCGLRGAPLGRSVPGRSLRRKSQVLALGLCLWSSTVVVPGMRPLRASPSIDGSGAARA